MLHITIDKKKLNEIGDISLDDVENLIKLAIEEEMIIDKEIYTSVIFMNKEEIKKINNKYRNINKETDVLSFPIFLKDEIKNTKLEHIELGDIILCMDVIKEQAIEYKTGIRREVLYMIAHGMFHLLRI